ncbi:MAG TPA: DUF5689 domain-containing protein [Bacteroidia bacterium]|jgi:hypothetical protein|nr:DUF5689 domain-containing protein [Bacteroidia bacterium]
MSKTKHISLLLLAAVAVTLVFSCKKKADMPPVTPYDVANTMTIQQLRAFFLSQGCNTYKFTKDVSLYAYVTMDASSGNIYKQVYLRDATGSISMKQLTSGGLFEGDYLRINLNGAYLDKASSGSYLQIDSVDVNSAAFSKVIKLDVQKHQTPVTVTIPQLLSSVTSNTCSMGQSIYDGQLIQLNDVEFIPVDTGLYYNNNITTHMPVSTTYTITDCGGLNSIAVYTSSYATEFFNKKVPSGSGSLIAVASFYNNVMQLTLRSIDEVNFNNPRCGVDTLTQTFFNCTSGPNLNTLLPGWYNVPQVGYLAWTGIPSTTPGYPGASNFGSSTTRNVMWLITPPIKSSATKNLAFQTGTSFGTPTHPQQLSVLLSTDYNGSNLGGTYPSSNPAHWYDITSSFPNIENGSIPGYFFTNASTSPVVLSSIPALSFLSGYTGTYYIGFRYTGQIGTDSTQTFAIKNVVIKN